MKVKTIYLILCFFGAVLPLSQFIPFIVDHGFDVGLMGQYLFANPISRFFAFDLLITALAVFIFLFVEGRRLGIRRLWIPVLCTCCVGVSLGFPVFLYMREVQVQKS